MKRLATVCVALAAALVPLPPTWIEEWYSQGFYPAIQAYVTPVTNLTPIAVLDLGAALLIALVVWWLLRSPKQAGMLRRIANGLLDAVALGAVAYLCFLAMWGLNYRRVPLEQKLDFDRDRVTLDAARRLARETVGRVNILHARQTAGSDSGPALDEAFAEAQRLLGGRRPAVPGVPKRSALGLYFRRAAIDGMTNPLALEIILNPDVLPAERPFVLAHEWAHLAGYADEAEANFVAWLTCLRGSTSARYSGWLSLYTRVIGLLPERDRLDIADELDAGPRRDLAAIAARYRSSMPLVRTAARGAYDKYLRANRVREGIESYDLVVQLVLGTRFTDGWVPQAR
ncbi:MAG TPA: DUF3810 family protein [Vicinamibacterales bacterium]|nr:DUF3810 family protein [Vicinamibacterales bacterium]